MVVFKYLAFNVRKVLIPGLPQFLGPSIHVCCEAQEDSHDHSSHYHIILNRIFNTFSACEALEDTLGYDWLLVFLSSHLHHSTVVLALRLLLQMLSHPPAMTRFRDGTSGGGWLKHADAVLSNRMGMQLGGYKFFYFMKVYHWDSFEVV